MNRTLFLVVWLLTLMSSTFAESFDYNSSNSDAFVLVSRHGKLQLWWPQKSWLVNVDLNRELEIQNPCQFQKVVAGFQGIYVLDQCGRLLSVLERKMIFEPAFPDLEGRDLLIDQEGGGIWILDGLGRLLYCPIIPSSTAVSYPSSMVNDPCAIGQDLTGQLWVVSKDGVLRSSQMLLPLAPKRPMEQEIIDFEFNPFRSGGFAMDRSAGLYAWGEASDRQLPIRPEFGQKVAVDLEFSPSFKDVYYILEYHGAIFSSSSETIQVVPETSSVGYQAMAVIPGPLLVDLWEKNYPSLSVGIEPHQLQVPYWRSSLRFNLNCDGAHDLTEFTCLIEFNPKVLSPKQVFQGELFRSSKGRGIIMDDSRSEEGILSIRGVSADRRSGTGMNGSGSLFEVEMEIHEAGSSSLKILEFDAISSSLPDSRIRQSGLSPGLVTVYSAQPSISLSLQALSALNEPIPRVQQEIQVGERFNLYLQVNHVKGMKGLRYDLKFDSNMIKLITVEEGEFLRRQGPTLVMVDSPEGADQTGWLKDQGIALLGRGEGASGPGEIMRYLFKGVCSGKATVQLEEAIWVDEDRVRLPLQVTSGHVELEIK